MNRFWIWHKHAAPAAQIGAHRLTPIAQLIGVRLPSIGGIQAGWLWQFPLAVEVETEGGIEGERQYLPIPNLTRTVLWLLYTLTAIAVGYSIATLWRRRSRSRNKLLKGSARVKRKS